MFVFGYEKTVECNLNKHVSLYLDVWRFGAALVVFLSHVASQKISGGLFWQVKYFDQTAVMIFFVMSGFVISYISSTKETALKEYSIARISRLYSVVVPALVITFVADYIGFSINPDFYTGGPWPFETNSYLLTYSLSFLMIQNIWDLGLNPGINQPFWSLTFEWVYYIAFAAVFYFKSHWKYAWLALILVLAGPTVVALFPIWLMGYFLYKAMPNDANQTTSFLSVLLSLSAVVALVLVGPEIRKIEFSSALISRQEIYGDYFDATMFCIHLYYLPYILHYVGYILEKYASIIRNVAACTFALYLFHRPLIQLIAATASTDLENTIYRVSLLLIPLLFVFTIGYWSEKQKVNLKNSLNKWYSKFEREIN